MAKTLNPNLAKIHRNYTVEEVALLFDVHKNTVRQWIKQGLNTVIPSWPLLVLGAELRQFIASRRAKKKRKCPPGTLYCVRCREPKVPFGEMVDYQPVSTSRGNLIGICPDCESSMQQFTGSKGLEKISLILEVSTPQAQKHISGCSDPSLNSDFTQ